MEMYMKSKIKIAGIVCSMSLLAFAGNVMACEDDSDHTLKSSTYYTPLISSNKGSYDNDRVMDKFGKYDSVLISSWHGEYNTLDMQDTVTHYYNPMQNTEFSFLASENNSRWYRKDMTLVPGW